MRTPRTVTALAGLVALSATALGAASSAAAGPSGTGPSTTTAPYVLPVASGVTTTSLLTVGDRASNGYLMAGIPDGLGAYDNGDGTFTVVMNHELGFDKGVVRRHGGVGAFVSKWVVDKATLRVISGEDLIQRVMVATGSTYSQATGVAAQLNRLCSADLPDQAAFYRAVNGIRHPQPDLHEW